MIGTNGFPAATDAAENPLVTIIGRKTDAEGVDVLESADGTKWKVTQSNPQLLTPYSDGLDVLVELEPDASWTDDAEVKATVIVDPKSTDGKAST